MSPDVLHAVSAGGAGVAVIVAICIMLRSQTKQADRRMVFERERAESSRAHFDQLQESHAQRLTDLSEAHAVRLADVVEDFKESSTSCHMNQGEATKAIKESTRVSMANTKALGKLEGILTTMAGHQAAAGPGMGTGEHPSHPPGPPAPEPS